MGYTVLKSFERGIDTRRLIDCVEPGALLDARNCHITRGGELEKRAAFVEVATLPATTIGLYVTLGPKFHTWGSAATAPAGMPANGVYHSIPDPDGAALVLIMSVEEFMGKLYVVAQYEGGKIIHWWDDVAVVTYIGAGGAIESPDGDPPIIVDPPPTGPEGKARATFYCNISWHTGQTEPEQGYLRGVYLYKPGSTYNFSGPDPDAFCLIDTASTDVNGRPYANINIPKSNDGANCAAVIMQQINLSSTLPNCTASATGNSVQIWIEELSTKYNGWTLHVVATKMQFAPNEMQALSGGQAVVPPTGLVTTYVETFDTGAAGETQKLGTFALAHNGKMYTVDGAILHFSMNNNPSRYDDLAEGAGYIDMTTVASGTPELLSLADYGGDLAIFGVRHILIYTMDPLPERNVKRQVLHRSGTIAPHSVRSYSESEVMYLDRSGIRSLRSRSAVDAAFGSDLGNAIDTLVVEKINASTVADRFKHFWSEVEPRTGRLWMVLKDVIYVLSYYPESRIAAWTWYDASDYPVDMMNASDESIFWRSGDSVIRYAGDTGAEYDDIEALARVPYVDAGKPATFKNWEAIDVALLGSWQIKASFDPTQPTALDLIANLTKSTYAQQKIAMNGESPSVSLELRSSYVGPARIGNVAVHYSDSSAD